MINNLDIYENLNIYKHIIKEYNLELFNNHSKVLRDKNLDLGYLNEEAKNSLDKFKKLEEIDEIRFDEYLDKFIKDI